MREQVACVIAHDARLAARAERLGRARRDDGDPGRRRVAGRRRAQACARHRRVRLRALRRRRVGLRVDVRGRGDSGEELARVVARPLDAVVLLPPRELVAGLCQRDEEVAAERSPLTRAANAPAACGAASARACHQR